MRVNKFLVSLLVVISIFTASFTPTFAVGVNSVEYNFDNSLSGYATGEIVIDSADMSGTYGLYWGKSSSEPLEGYNALATVTLTAGQQTIYRPYNKTIIPEGVTHLLLVNADNSIVISKMIPPSKRFSTAVYGDKKYSFGQLSDTHDADDKDSKFENALSFLRGKNAELVAICGDLVQEKIESEYQNHAAKIAPYKDIMPVYSSAGNHDSSKLLNFGWWKKYTNYGNGELFFEVKHKGDVFLFMGMVNWDLTTPFTVEEMQWLENKLEEHKDKRVFIQNHLFLENTSGSLYHKDTGKNLYQHVWSVDSAQEHTFRRLMMKYKNVVYFSGHSHWRHDHQKFNENLNVYDGGGKYSNMVHVSSVTTPRITTNLISMGTDYTASEGYLVDVYEDAVVLKAVDFKKGSYITEANYLLDYASSKPAFESALRGDGSEINPYAIDNNDDFNLFTREIQSGYEFKGKYISQTANIDMSGYEGYQGLSDEDHFSGIYNGNGNNINVTIQDNAARNISVFPNVTGIVMNVSVTGSISQGKELRQASGLATRVMKGGAVINSFSTASVTAPKAAGIAFYNYGVISNCYFAGAITAEASDSHSISSINNHSFVNAPFNSYYLSGAGSNAFVRTKEKTAAEMASQSFVDLLNSNAWQAAEYAGISGHSLKQWNTSSSYPVFANTNISGQPPASPSYTADLTDDFTTYTSNPKHYSAVGMALRTGPFSTQFSIFQNALTLNSESADGAIIYKDDNFGGKDLITTLSFSDSFMSVVNASYNLSDYWNAYEEALYLSKIKVFAGSTLENMQPVERLGNIYVKQSQSMSVAGQIVTPLPAGTKFVKISVGSRNSSVRLNKVEFVRQDLTRPVRIARSDEEMKVIDVEILSIVLKDKNRLNTTEKIPGGFIEGAVIRSSKARNAHVMFAIYDKDKLVSVKFEPMAFVAGKNTIKYTLFKLVAIPQDIEINDLIIKVFCWDNVDKVSPISTSLEV